MRQVAGPRPGLARAAGAAFVAACSGTVGKINQGWPGADTRGEHTPTAQVPEKHFNLNGDGTT